MHKVRVPWKNWKPNRRFLFNLRAEFGRRQFSSQMAYDVYAFFHQNRRERITGFGDMNVRNTLNAAVYFGLLYRPKNKSRGWFTFRKDGAECVTE